MKFGFAVFCGIWALAFGLFGVAKVFSAVWYAATLHPGKSVGSLLAAAVSVGLAYVAALGVRACLKMETNDA